VAAPASEESEEELEDEDWETPASDADDFEPVPTPTPRARPARDDRYADRPLLADARHVEPEEPEPEPEDDEDAYLTELRKAMTDDAPLGPRDEPEDHLGGAPTSGRSRFGRRR
jgi:hypothetical protein